MTLPIRMVPLPRSVAITAALLLAIAFTSLLIPSAHAQTGDSALAPSYLTAERVDGHVFLDVGRPELRTSGPSRATRFCAVLSTDKDTMGILVSRHRQHQYGLY